MRTLLVTALAVLAACSVGGARETSEGRGDAAAPPAAASIPTCLAQESVPFESEVATLRGDAVDEALGTLLADRLSFGLSPQRLALSKLDTNDARMFATTSGADLNGNLPSVSM